MKLDSVYQFEEIVQPGVVSFPAPRVGGAFWALSALFLADILILTFSLISSIALLVLVQYQLQPSFLSRQWPVIILILLVYAASGMYKEIGRHPVEEMRVAVKATTLAFLAAAAGAYMIREVEPYLRTVLALTWMQTILLVPLARSFVARHFGACQWWGQGLIVLGGGQMAQRAVEVLKANPGIRLKPVVILDNDPGKRSNLCDVPIVGGLEQAQAIADTMGIRYALIAMPELSREQLLEILRRYGRGFARILLIPNLLGISSLWVEATDLGGILGLKLRQNLLDPWAKAAKRVMDLILAVGLVLLLAPLILIICLLVKVTSRGPLVYTQMRIGEGGRPIRVFKFRTMVKDAEVVLRNYLKNEPEALAEWTRHYKLRKDPRVTGVGRLLRRSSLDELPQLWNVLRGELALVGPRPLMIEEVSTYGDTYQLYSAVRPGITGLWQVSGRNNLPYGERVRLNEYYVRNWSVWLDLYILARTVKAVVSGEGAY